MSFLEVTGDQATTLSIRVLEEIIKTIRKEQDYHQDLLKMEILSDEDYSVLDANLEADILVYQTKIDQLSSSLNLRNKPKYQWND